MSKLTKAQKIAMSDEELKSYYDEKIEEIKNRKKAAEKMRKDIEKELLNE